MASTTGQRGERSVVQDLVEAALAERGIDRQNGVRAGSGKPGCKGERVFLGDADVVEPVGEHRAEGAQPRPVAHCGGDGDERGIGLRTCADNLAEQCGKAGAAAVRVNTAGFVKRADRMVGVGRCSAPGYPFPLVVQTWTTQGFSILFASRSTVFRRLMLLPSTGPMYAKPSSSNRFSDTRMRLNRFLTPRSRRKSGLRSAAAPAAAVPLPV